jgi:hypothetical protein
MVPPQFHTSIGVKNKVVGVGKTMLPHITIQICTIGNCTGNPKNGGNKKSRKYMVSCIDFAKKMPSYTS